MKILIIAVIVLVVPFFFALIFVMSAYNRLSALRRRCESARVRLHAAIASKPGTSTHVDSEIRRGEEALAGAVAEYNRERAQPLHRLVSTIFGFKEAA